MADREKVIGHLNDCMEASRRDNTWVFVRKDIVDDAIDLLKEQEVKTGKWIEQTDYLGDTYYDCSVCNESWMTIEGTPWVNGMNYCPHCGAKMEFESR